MSRIEVCYAAPESQTLVELELDDGATVASALAAVADREPFSGLNLDEMAVGVFGERVEREHRLRDGDRVELYRSLVMDPKTARKRRAES